jgi:hypothetical protein
MERYEAVIRGILNSLSAFEILSEELVYSIYSLANSTDDSVKVNINRQLYSHIDSVLTSSLAAFMKRFEDIQR